ncbi:MAG: hypothetical protein Q9195_005424 [Heterodermia aff. obscurata]
MSYSLTITVDPCWVNYYGNKEYQFCFARTATSPRGKNSMDIIAYTEDVAAKIDVDWTTPYSMAASKKGFSAGSDVTVSMAPLPIKFGQAFTLPNLAHPIVADDASAPADGFIFNNTPPAAAVLYEVIKGKNTPASINPLIVPMTTTKSTINFNKKGQWELFSESMDYSRGKHAKSQGLAKGSIDSQEAPNSSQQKASEDRTA